MTLRDATQIAEEARLAITPYCKVDVVGRPLCVTAGSVRRQKMDMIKDVEIVAVPDGKWFHELAKLVNGKWGEPSIGKYPSQYTRIRGRYNLDIYWCTTETFGMTHFIRTGPDAFTRRFFSEWKRKTNGGYFECDRLVKGDGTPVRTPTEQSVFDALEWNFVKPENRT